MQRRDTGYDGQNVSKLPGRSNRGKPQRRHMDVKVTCRGTKTREDAWDRVHHLQWRQMMHCGDS